MRSIVRIYSVRGFGLTGKSCVQPAKPSENCQLFHAAVAYSSSSANICMLYACANEAAAVGVPPRCVPCPMAPVKVAEQSWYDKHADMLLPVVFAFT